MWGNDSALHGIDSGKPRQTSTALVLPYAVLLCAAIVVSLPNLFSPAIDDLDSAHHLMDGYFFRDVIAHPPLSHPIAFTYSYYKQYPALGFVFWPPFFALIEGIFFLVAGFSVQTARVAILFFGVLLAWASYASTRKLWGTFIAASGSVLILFTPIVASFYRQVMLEIPALGMIFLTLYFYYKLVTADRPGWQLISAFIVAAALAAYTKQTAVFIYPALALDWIVNHRNKISAGRAISAGALFIALLLPLAVFTLTVSRASLQQSFGSDKSYVLNSHKPPDRWTVEGFTYYPRQLLRLVNPVIVSLGVVAVVYGFRNPSFLSRNLIWFGWIIFWYVLFSLFLNKQSRYAVFWCPGWVLLSMSLLGEWWRRFPTRRVWISAAPVLSLCFALPGFSALNVRGYLGMETAVRGILSQPQQGNIAYFGDFRQLFVPYVREYDNSHAVHTLQGDDLLEGTDFSRLSSDYHIRYILVETSARQSPLSKEGAVALSGNAGFEKLPPISIETPQQPMEVQLFRYTGAFSPAIREIPLRSKFVSDKSKRGAAER